MEQFIQYGYFGLFAGSFLAATILPLGSEIIFIGLLSLGFNPALCLAIASIGNTLGGMTNYILGRMGKTEWIEKYLRVPPQEVKKLKQKLQGKNAAFAFFSFLPFIGDPLAIVLGLMRANAVITISAMFCGKFLRYAILALPFC